MISKLVSSAVGWFVFMGFGFSLEDKGRVEGRLLLDMVARVRWFLFAPPREIERWLGEG